MKPNLMNGASPAVNAAASAKPIDQDVARKAAAAALTLSTGLDALAAYTGVGVVMASMQKSGLVTVAEADLAQIGKTVEVMKFALAQAYVAIDGHETDRGDDSCGNSAEGMAVLALIEQVLGGKPQRVPDPTQAAN